MKLKLLAFLAVSLGAVPAWAASEGKPCKPEPTDQVITGGDVLTGADCVISPITDRDFFSFPGLANETYRLIATPFGATICVEIHEPTPPKLLKNGCSGGALILDVQLSKPGTHRIVISEWGNDHTASYNLSLTRLFPFPSDAVALPYSQVMSDMVDPVTDLDSFVFYGKKDATITLVATPLSGGTLCIELYDPVLMPVKDINGTTVSACSGGSIARDIKLPQSGKYLVVMTEWGNDHNLSYNLSLHCLFGDCDPKLPICEVTAAYNAGALDLTFTLRSVTAANWDLWLNVESTMKHIIKAKPFKSDHPRTFNVTIAPFPPSGRIGLINTLSRASKGNTCTDLTLVNTGDPVGTSFPTAEELESLIQRAPLIPQP